MRAHPPCSAALSWWQPERGERWGPGSRSHLMRLLELVARLQQKVPLMQPPELLDTILQESGMWERHVRKVKTAKKEAEDLGGPQMDEDGGSVAVGVGPAGGMGESEEEEEEEGRGRGRAAAEAPEGNSSEEEFDEEAEGTAAPAVDPLAAYEFRAKYYGAVRVVLREAARFTERWQPCVEFTQDEDFLQGRGPPSLVRLMFQAVFASTTSDREGWRRLAEAGAEEELATVAAVYKRGPIAMREFLSFICLDPEDASEGSVSPLEDGVVISTIHAAKGLEWDVIFSPRWNDGFLPTMPCEEDGPQPGRPQSIAGMQVPSGDPEAEHMAEEQRLAHVAATRPKQRHYISYCRVGRVKGKAFRFTRSKILEPVMELVQARERGIVFSEEEEDDEEEALLAEADSLQAAQDRRQQEAEEEW